MSASAAIAKTPTPPYYAVIFTSLRTAGDNGYGVTADRMVEIAQTMPGYLGVESARDGLGITVCYWQTLDDIAAWKAQAEHDLAQKMGREKWYQAYHLRVAKVEREYGFARPDSPKLER